MAKPTSPAAAAKKDRRMYRILTMLSGCCALLFGCEALTTTVGELQVLYLSGAFLQAVVALINWRLSRKAAARLEQCD